MSAVKIQFLGSGDAFGSGGRLQTCIYVESDSMPFLLDCGTTALIGRKRWVVNPSLVETILVTHLHGDHFGGLPFFILDAQFNARRTQPLIIAGPPGLETRVRQAMEVFFPGSSLQTQRFKLEFIEMPERVSTSVNGLTVTPFAVVHASGAPAYALRVECQGKTIAYSGDTEWTEALLEVATGADLFISEAYFLEKRVRYHLDYRTLLSHRKDLNCRRLIVTHLHTDMLGRLAEIDVEVAEEGAVISL